MYVHLVALGAYAAFSGTLIFDGVRQEIQSKIREWEAFKKLAESSVNFLDRIDNTLESPGAKKLDAKLLQILQNELKLDAFGVAESRNESFWAKFLRKWAKLKKLFSRETLTLVEVRQEIRSKIKEWEAFKKLADRSAKDLKGIQADLAVMGADALQRLQEESILNAFSVGRIPENELGVIREKQEEDWGKYGSTAEFASWRESWLKEFHAAYNPVDDGDFGKRCEILNLILSLTGKFDRSDMTEKMEEVLKICKSIPINLFPAAQTPPPGCEESPARMHDAHHAFFYLPGASRMREEWPR